MQVPGSDLVQATSSPLRRSVEGGGGEPHLRQCFPSVIIILTSTLFKISFTFESCLHHLLCHQRYIWIIPPKDVLNCDPCRRPLCFFNSQIKITPSPPSSSSPPSPLEASGEGGAADEGEEGEAAPGCHLHWDLGDCDRGDLDLDDDGHGQDHAPSSSSPPSPPSSSSSSSQ